MRPSASPGCRDVLDFLSKLPVEELSAAASFTFLLRLLVGEEPASVGLRPEAFGCDMCCGRFAALVDVMVGGVC